MPSATEENTDRVVRALVDLIRLLDYWRPPPCEPTFGPVSWPVHTLLQPEHRLERYDPDFPKDIISWVKEFQKYEGFREMGLGSAKIVSIRDNLLFSKYHKGYIKGRKHASNDSDLKKMAQRTIDYAREYFKNNNIDPKDYPIKLAFNDYQGLIYERKGRRYLAFIKVEGIGD